MRAVAATFEPPSCSTPPAWRRYPKPSLVDTQRKQEAFQRGIDCFNRGEFFTCHEIWEEIWLEEPEAEKPYYQGLIQVAAAFHHWQKGNRQGASSLLRRGMKKLRRYPPAYQGIDLAALRAALELWLGRLEGSGSTQGLPLPTIHLAG